MDQGYKGTKGQSVERAENKETEEKNREEGIKLTQKKINSQQLQTVADTQKKLVILSEK